MTVVLTCGHPYSGYLPLHQAMLGAGLKPAKPSSREQLSPEDIQNKLCVAHKANASFSRELVQLVPGKAWQGLSVDLFIANIDHELWGWADAKTIYMLNYWRDFDPQTRFVLVYSSPDYALAQLLREKEISPDCVESLFLSWQRFNAELLSFYNRNQECSILVNVEALSRPEEASRLLSVLRDRLGINLSAQVDWCIDPPQNDAVFSLFASSLTQEYPTVQDQYQELESAADIICDFSEPQKQQIAKAFVQYQYLAVQYDEARALSTQQSTQISDLQSQLIQIQQELAFEKQKPDLSSQHKELKEENELLLLQLHLVQEELEHHFLQSQQLTQARDEQAKLASEQQGHLAKTQSECENLKDRNANLKRDLNNVESKLKEVQTIASSKHAELTQENELLLLQLHQVQEELEHHFLQSQQLSAEQVKAATERQVQIQQLTQARDEQAKLASEQQGHLAKTQSECENLKDKNANLKRDLNNVESKFKEVQTIAPSKHAELTQENELLLLQLHQVQEELEQYFLKYQEIKQGQIMPAEQVEVDFCKPVNGDNWYDAEADGCWAGPEKSSTLKLPKTQPGRYQIELEIVDAMAPEIVKGTKFSLNGTPLNFVDTQPIPLLKRLLGKKRKYPIILWANADIDPAKCNAGLELGFEFPRLISPASRGSDDTRHLALRLKTVKLKPLL